MTSATQVNMRHWLARTQSAAAVVTAGVTGLLVIAAAIAGGAAAAQSEAIGGGLVVLFFGLGALGDGWALRRFELTAIFVVLGGYLVRVGLLTVTAGLLASAALLPSVTWFAVGVTAGTFAWLAGVIFGHVSGRWPVFDVEVAA